MDRSRTSTSTPDKAAAAAVLWGCELSQEKRTWTFRPQKDGKDCKVLLNTICLGEKVKGEMNLVEILPPPSLEEKRTKPIIIASLQASVLPTVTMGLELSPPVTFQLRAGLGPVFLSGQECYEIPEVSWEEEEGEEEDQSEDDDDDDDDEVEEVSLEDSPVKQGKRLSSQKQASVAKKKKVEKEEEAVRVSLKGKSPVNKARYIPKGKKLVPKK